MPRRRQKGQQRRVTVYKANVKRWFRDHGPHPLRDSNKMWLLKDMAIRALLKSREQTQSVPPPRVGFGSRLRSPDYLVREQGRDPDEESVSSSQPSSGSYGSYGTYRW